MNKKIGLTPTQFEVYKFIVAYHNNEGVYPTVREIGKGTIDGEKIINPRASPNTVIQILEKLDQRGWIERSPAMARGIYVPT